LILSGFALGLGFMALLNGHPLAALLIVVIAGAPALFMWSATYSITYYARGK
jgi:hypothetical protein